MPFYALHCFWKSVFLQPSSILGCGLQSLNVMKLISFVCLRMQLSVTEEQQIVMLGKYCELGCPEEVAEGFGEIVLWTEGRTKYGRKDLRKQRHIVLVFWIIMVQLVSIFFFLLFMVKKINPAYKVLVCLKNFAPYCPGLQKKETAKSLLRGIRTAQSRFPSLDVEHFPTKFLITERMLQAFFFSSFWLREIRDWLISLG